MTNRGNNTREKALFLSAHLPSPTIPAAGQNLAFRNLRELAERYDVILVSFVNSNEQPYLDESQYDFCHSSTFVKISNRTRLVSAFVYPLLPFKSGVRHSQAVKAILRNFFDSYDIKFVHFEYTSVASYISSVPGGVSTKILCQDVVFQSYQRFYQERRGVVRCLYFFEYVRQRKWECSILKKFDRVVVLNDKDKDILSAVDVVDVKVEYPMVPSWISAVPRDNIAPNTIMFLGALNRPENKDAVLFFLDFVLPQVRREIPNCIFYVVGAFPPDELLARASDKVIVTGFVESLHWYFATCQIAVAPLRFGAGIKTKVLETLAAGMPTVCSEVGAEGVLAEDNLIVCGSVDEMSRAIISQLQRLGSV